MVEELIQWGEWANRDNHGLGYTSPMLIVMRDNVQRSSNSSIPQISDEYAGKVDRAVSTLKQYNEKLWELIVLRYKLRFKKKEMSKLISEKYGTKHTSNQLSMMIERAEGFILGRLSDF